ncbi:suppressor of variegation 3-7 isoform 2-T2 [Cochliomyia hominivorax]
MHEMEIDTNVCEKRNAKENSTEDKVICTGSHKQHDHQQNVIEDDLDSVIMEEVENKTIDVDEVDSSEELIDDDRNQRVNESFTKETEFVIVNAENTSAVACGVETDVPSRYEVEDIEIKDELCEAIAADLSTHNVLENDPMDLLELNTRSECTSSTRSHPDTEDYGDDRSSIGSMSIQTGSSSSIGLFDWIKDYPWLLYDELDENFGYCLYCDTKINVKSVRSVKQHGFSLYHKERCENYLAFREEEEKNGISMKLIEIKEEFGTDSRVEALKLKRRSQSVALNNFNWRRWLDKFRWLERDAIDGTIGYCKYCHMHVNVEFSYLRERHQESAKHKEAEKQYEEKNYLINEQNNSSKINDVKGKNTLADNSKAKKWLEILKTDPTMVLCKVCGTTMTKNNFQRHSRTNLHEQNVKIYLQNIQKTDKPHGLHDESSKAQHNWMIYAKSHPWLVSDPSDASFAYCTYCEKRIIYGASAAKRTTHENSSQHKHNESEFKKSLRNLNANKECNENGRNGDKKHIASKDGEYNESGEDEINIGDQNNENKDDNEEESNEGENEKAKSDCEGKDDEGSEKNKKEKESEDDNDSKLSEEWINQYPWCKRYSKDPKNYIFCIYCKISLRVHSSRIKHQKTSSHISAEKEYLNRQYKKQKMQERKLYESSPFYEWAIPLKSSLNCYSCRYCRVRISKNYSQKQHASSKIHQINENIYKSNRRKSMKINDHNSSDKTQAATKIVTQLANKVSLKNVQTFAKVVIKSPSTLTLIKQWQKKFPWLSYKRTELRSNYGHCKLCDCSLYIRSFKHVLRHVRSPRHIKTIKANKKQKVEKDEEFVESEDAGADEISLNKFIKEPKEELRKIPKSNIATSARKAKNSESPKAFNYKSTITELKKRFSWIENSDLLNNAFCRFCNCNVPLKILFLRNHSNSKKHRYSVINYQTVDRKRSNNVVQGKNIVNVDVSKSDNGGIAEEEDDVMIVEENSEEILISEHDENWTVKSELMDEHEELDYLLHRSINNQNQNKSNIRNVRKSNNNEDNPPPKHLKRSQSFRRFNDSNTSLMASLLSTPLTLASCLGPLIQQQIQQHTNISQISQTNFNQSARPTTDSSLENVAENTFDLFFKSISQTMKKLPVDLAAEGKLRVMQIICDLELQALKRQQNTQNEYSSSNISGRLCYQPTSTSTSTNINAMYNNSSVQDTSSEQYGSQNETIISQVNINTDVSPQLSPSSVPSVPAVSSSIQTIPNASSNPSAVENSGSNNDSNSIIGLMDKNGLQTIHVKIPVSKEIPGCSNTNPITPTANANPGIRCIPFKNLSQTTSSDAKITRIQVPMNVTAHSPIQNTNPVSTTKNLINFRNIQITKRIAASTASSVCTPSTHQQTAPNSSTIMSKSPQRTFITNIQPHLQRWGCSVNGKPSSHTPTTSSVVSNINQLSSEQTSTPISKNN